MNYEILAQKIINTLPSGSGFDCDYDYIVTKTGIKIASAHHCMNDAGYFEGL